MKNKKGFTLVELLVVIVILAVVILVAVPSVMGVNKLINKKMLEEKAEVIESAAVLFGQDMKNSIMASSKKYNSFPCKSIAVGYLVPSYLDYDVNNEQSCVDSMDGDKTTGCVIDPSNEEKYMDTLEVIIYYKNKRIKAVVDLDGNLTCE